MARVHTLHCWCVHRIVRRESRPCPADSRCTTCRTSPSTAGIRRSSTDQTRQQFELIKRKVEASGSDSTTRATVVRTSHLRGRTLPATRHVRYRSKLYIHSPQRPVRRLVQRLSHTQQHTCKLHSRCISSIIYSRYRHTQRTAAKIDKNVIFRQFQRFHNMIDSVKRCLAIDIGSTLVE